MLHKTVDLESTGRARGTAICSSLLPLPPPQASWRVPNPRCALVTPFVNIPWVLLRQDTVLTVAPSSQSGGLQTEKQGP